MQRFQPHGYRTLIERTIGRVEYLRHQMAFATGKNKMDVGSKLDIGTQQRFRTRLWIIGYLLEFINSDIYLMLTLGKIAENRFQRHFRKRRLYTYRDCWHIRQWISAEYRAP